VLVSTGQPSATDHPTNPSGTHPWIVQGLTIDVDQGSDLPPHTHTEAARLRIGVSVSNQRS